MKRLHPTQSTEQGFSLLEPLVAILILAAVMSAFTPPMVLAIATRIRTFRVEQAIKVAQSEVDRNRRLIERETTAVALNPKLPPAVTPNSTNPEDVDPPTSTTPSSTSGDGYCTNSSLPTTAQDWCIVPPNPVPNPEDPEDSSKAVLGMQVFRTQVFNLDGTAGSDTTKLPVAYRLGVRIYPINALKQNAGNLQKDTSNLSLSSASQSLSAPLAVLYAPIARSDFRTDSESSLRRLCVLNKVESTDKCPDD